MNTIVHLPLRCLWAVLAAPDLRLNKNKDEQLYSKPLAVGIPCSGDSLQLLELFVFVCLFFAFFIVVMKLSSFNVNIV